MGERVLTAEQVAECRTHLGHGISGSLLERLCNTAEALRAALTQSAERVRHLEAIPWTCAYCGEAFAGADRPRESLQAHVAVCEKHPLRAANEKVARLERTVERMREALSGIADHPTGWPGADEENASMRGIAAAALAASSPDHAGAPEGELDPAIDLGLPYSTVLRPSVEAGETT